MHAHYAALGDVVPNSRLVMIPSAAGAGTDDGWRTYLFSGPARGVSGSARQSRACWYSTPRFSPGCMSQRRCASPVAIDDGAAVLNHACRKRTSGSGGNLATRLISAHHGTPGLHRMNGLMPHLYDVDPGSEKSRSRTTVLIAHGLWFTTSPYCASILDIQYPLSVRIRGATPPVTSFCCQTTRRRRRWQVNKQFLSLRLPRTSASLHVR
jgi:hypothetical protein